jgi:hypothetical protein
MLESWNYSRILLPIKAKPSMPEPKSSMVAGSGTGEGVPTEADHEKFASSTHCPVKFHCPGVSAKPVALSVPNP